MIGLFDSGTGGVNVLGYLRKLLPREDIFLLCDKANCPYGTRSTEDVRRIAEANISRLRTLGAERILIACCTASAALPRESLPQYVISAIQPAANAAALASDGGIALLATETTVRSEAFGDALGERLRLSVAAPSLVEMIESGINDETATEEDKDELYRLILPLKNSGCNGLILGCTHFSSLKASIAEIAREFGITHITDSAMTAALAMADLQKESQANGITYRLTT